MYCGHHDDPDVNIAKGIFTCSQPSAEKISTMSIVIRFPTAVVIRYRAWAGVDGHGQLAHSPMMAGTWFIKMARGTRDLYPSTLVLRY